MNQPPPPPGGPFPPPPGGGPYPGAGGRPPWPQQGQWPGQPPQPPKRGNGWKWALGAVALVAVIGVTAAVTLVVSGGDGGDGPPAAAPPGNGAHSDIASANDTRPVEIITEDPSCAPARPILETRAAAQDNGWGEREPSVPATAWTPEVRAQYETIAQSMRQTADQLVQLVKLTPHRVMRELYEQLIAYSRAYADSIPTYTPPDDNLALVTVGAATAITGICAAIDTGSAAARAPLVSLPAATPSQIAAAGDPADPQRFLTEANRVCPEWERALTQYHNDIGAWNATDPDIPGSQWTPQQRAINDEVAPVMSRFASQVRALGTQSDNAILQDFAELSAQYLDAYVKALPTYTPADMYLPGIANMLNHVVTSACLAA